MFSTQWRSIVTLYSGNRELQSQVETAQRRLANPEAAEPPAKEAEQEHDAPRESEHTDAAE